MLVSNLLLFTVLPFVHLVSIQDYTWGDWERCVGEASALSCFERCKGLVSEHRRDSVKVCLIFAAQKQVQTFTQCLLQNGYSVNSSTKCFGRGLRQQATSEAALRFKRSEEDSIVSFGNCITSCKKPAQDSCQTCTPVTYFDHTTIPMIVRNCNKWHSEIGYKEVADRYWIACLQQIGYNVERAASKKPIACSILTILTLLITTIVYAWY